MISDGSGWALFQQFALLEAKIVLTAKQVLGSHVQMYVLKL